MSCSFQCTRIIHLSLNVCLICLSIYSCGPSHFKNHCCAPVANLSQKLLTAAPKLYCMPESHKELQKFQAKHPVSCIEPRLAIHFLYDIIHVSMPFSQIIPLDAWGWCTGITQRDGMGREVGVGFRSGNLCTPVADSC